MKIGITLKNNSYTPEAYAYEKYLISKGWSVQLDYELDPNNDINIYFMGIRPFWGKREGKAIEIHEYQSLSVPKYSKLKDYIKTKINRVPDGRIFLNDIVSSKLNFRDNVPHIYRDMGIDDAFFQKPNINPEFDIIYCGSILGRVGLVEVLLNLAERYKVLIVGDVPRELLDKLRKPNISLMGRVDREYLPELYRNARYGLNYTPDIYPFNIQTSTKTLEYLASGLHVISNKYIWSSLFFSSIGYEPIWINSSGGIESNRNIVKPDMSQYSWYNILEKNKFNDFLLNWV